MGRPLRVWMEPGAEPWSLWGPLPALCSSTPPQLAGPALARGPRRGASAALASGRGTTVGSHPKACVCVAGEGGCVGGVSLSGQFCELGTDV